MQEQFLCLWQKVPPNFIFFAAGPEAFSAHISQTNACDGRNVKPYAHFPIVISKQDEGVYHLGNHPAPRCLSAGLPLGFLPKSKPYAHFPIVISKQDEGVYHLGSSTMPVSRPHT